MDNIRFPKMLQIFYRHISNKNAWYSFIHIIYTAKLKMVVYYTNIKYFVGSFMYSNIRWSWRFAVQREGKWKFGENFLALTKYTFGKGVERNKITWKRRGWDEILSLCIYRCVSDSLRLLLRRMLQTPFLSKTHSNT